MCDEGISISITQKLSRDLAGIFNELDLVKHLCILKEPLLQRDDQELRVLEMLGDHDSDILSVRLVKGCIDLIKDVKRGWLKLKKSQD